MTLLHLYFSLFGLLLSEASIAAEKLKVPDYLKWYLHFEQNYNQDARMRDESFQKTRMWNKTFRPLPFVDFKQPKWINSSLSNNAGRSIALIAKEKRSFFPMVADLSNVQVKLTHPETMKNTCCYSRISGWSSFIVLQEGLEPFVLKALKTDETDQKSTSAVDDQLEAYAVMHSDFMSALNEGHPHHREKPQEKLLFLPETLYQKTNRATVAGVSHFNLFRELGAIKEEHKKGNTVVGLQALIGFLGASSGQASPLSIIKIKPQIDWVLNTLIPAMASFLAKLHLRLGILHQSHAQNLLVSIDRNGNVRNVILKDFGAMIFDPLTQKQNCLEDISKQFLPQISIFSNIYARPEHFIRKKGEFLSDAIFQALTLNKVKRWEQIKVHASFVYHYVKNAELILDSGPLLSKEFFQALEGILKQKTSLGVENLQILQFADKDKPSMEHLIYPKDHPFAASNLLNRAIQDIAGKTLSLALPSQYLETVEKMTIGNMKTLAKLVDLELLALYLNRLTNQELEELAASRKSHFISEALKRLPNDKLSRSIKTYF